MTQTPAATSMNESVSVLTSPHWLGVFMGIAIACSLVPTIIGFLLGFSVRSDVVFGVYALFGGAAADGLIRWKLARSLVLFGRPRIPFISLWALLCLYVIVFRPFE